MRPRNRTTAEQQSGTLRDGAENSVIPLEGMSGVASLDESASQRLEGRSAAGEEMAAVLDCRDRSDVGPLAYRPARKAAMASEVRRMRS